MRWDRGALARLAIAISAALLGWLGGAAGPVRETAPVAAVSVMGTRVLTPGGLAPGGLAPGVVAVARSAPTASAETGSIRLNDAFVTWQRRVPYAVRQPMQTHGLVLREFIEMSCGVGRQPSALATYAARADRDAWFDGPFLVLSQGDPLCAEPPLGPARTRLWQGGGQLRVHVACGDPAVNILCGRGTLRDFDRFGGTVQARFPRVGVRLGTDVRIDAGGLTLEQVLGVATSLAPVSGG
ncbi:MAG: hypothetical protein KGP10_05500 [Actinomycetales bacterium]|nr:hypothetical protein [Actinomycetales bacterium]